MSEKYIVACDGSSASERALDFAVANAKSTGASILVAHVLEWSPYSFLTPEELEERHKRRAEELDRAQKAVVDKIVKSVSDQGVKVESVIKYGHVAETLADIAKQEGATQMFIGRTGHSGIAARVFGSVAVTLAQIAPVPCTLVP